MSKCFECERPIVPGEKVQTILDSRFATYGNPTGDAYAVPGAPCYRRYHEECFDLVKFKLKELKEKSLFDPLLSRVLRCAEKAEFNYRQTLELIADTALQVNSELQAQIERNEMTRPLMIPVDKGFALREGIEPLMLPPNDISIPEFLIHSSEPSFNNPSIEEAQKILNSRGKEYFDQLHTANPPERWSLEKTLEKIRLEDAERMKNNPDAFVKAAPQNLIDATVLKNHGPKDEMLCPVCQKFHEYDPNLSLGGTVLIACPEMREGQYIPLRSTVVVCSDDGITGFVTPQGGINKAEIETAEKLLNHFKGDTDKLSGFCYCGHWQAGHVQGADRPNSTQSYGKCNARSCECKMLRPILTKRLTTLEKAMTAAKPDDLITLPVGYEAFKLNPSMGTAVLTYNVEVRAEEIAIAADIINVYGFEDCQKMCFCGHHLVEDHRGIEKKCFGCVCTNPRAILVEAKHENS